MVLLIDPSYVHSTNEILKEELNWIIERAKQHGHGKIDLPQPCTSSEILSGKIKKM